MTIFYFTATGNSLAVAKQIGGNLISIPQVIDSDTTHYKDDAIGIVFPVFFHREPRMVRRFLNQVKLEADYIFAVATYGGTHGITMARLQERAKRNGFQFDYTNYLMTVDNYLPLFEMGTQIEKQPKKKVEEHTAKIVDDIQSRKRSIVAEGFVNYLIAPFVPPFLPKENTAKTFLVNSQCNKCGICPKVCPAKNISLHDNVQFADHCEVCLACAHLCPQNAIHLKKQKSDKRWKNPEVSLGEIVAANNRVE